MRKELCGTCKFWAADNEDSGQCRRRSPIMQSNAAHFPLTHRMTWCGEWQPVPSSIRLEDIYDRCDVRGRKMLARHLITTTEQLISYRPSQLLKFKNFGLTSLRRLEDALRHYGLKLAVDGFDSPATHPSASDTD